MVDKSQSVVDDRGYVLVKHTNTVYCMYMCTCTQTYMYMYMYIVKSLTLSALTAVLHSSEVGGG